MDIDELHTAGEEAIENIEAAGWYMEGSGCGGAERGRRLSCRWQMRDTDDL